MEYRDIVTPTAGSQVSVRAAEPDLRVSDAERDQAVTALGRHFQAGRLDQAEFDGRMSAALSARTRRDLRSLFADLPPDKQPGEPGGAPAASGRGHPLLPLLPLAIVAIFIVGGLTGGAHDHGAAGWAPWPLLWLWILIPMAVIRLRMASRRRQWR